MSSNCEDDVVSKYLPNNSSYCTRAVHAGFETDYSDTGALVPPISTAAVYKQHDPETRREFFYSRLNNPSRSAVERSLATLEEAEFAVAFGSGTAAIAAVIQMLRPGDHIMASKHLYSGTWTFFQDIVKRQGIEVDFVDLRDVANFQPSLKSNTRLVWVESPTNPTLDIIDLQALAALTAQFNDASEPVAPDDRLPKKLILVVDNTFLSPYFQRPLVLGFDIVIHSCTKYLNGASDVVMGVACTNCPKLHEQLVFMQRTVGAVPSPFDCYFLQRSLRTLPLRMEQHMRNGLGVARFLETHPRIRKVLHPGLPSHPQHELSLRQSYGHSGMVSFYLQDDDIEKAKTFVKALRTVALSTSLGGVESTAQLPLLMTHAGVPYEENKAAGVTESLIRLSVGIEDLDDIIQDLDQALNVAYGH